MSAGDVRSVSLAWEQNAHQWLAWARTPEHDVYFWELNLPAFAELLPAAGRRTVDLGCGEGRLGRWLVAAGHRVVGIDSSPTLAAHAADAGGYEEASVPTRPRCRGRQLTAISRWRSWSCRTCPSPAAAIREIARVLAPGGVLCLAVVHPLNRPVGFLGDYFTERRISEVVARRGLEMRFEGVDRPLESYTRALSAAGLVIEALREPPASSTAVARAPELAPAERKPFFLHLRCRLDKPKTDA